MLNDILSHALVIQGAVEISACGGLLLRALLLIAVCGLFLMARDFKRFVYFAATNVLGQAACWVLKYFIERPRPLQDLRPVVVDAYSFPSGHAMMSFILYFSLWIVFKDEMSPAVRRYLFAVTCLAVGMIGLSRILLGVHFPTDVLGGWLFGAVWIAASSKMFRKSRKRF